MESPVLETRGYRFKGFFLRSDNLVRLQKIGSEKEHFVAQVHRTQVPADEFAFLKSLSKDVVLTPVEIIKNVALPRIPNQNLHLLVFSCPDEGATLRKITADVKEYQNSGYGLDEDKCRKVILTMLKQLQQLGDNHHGDLRLENILYFKKDKSLRWVNFAATHRSESQEEQTKRDLSDLGTATVDLVFGSPQELDTQVKLKKFEEENDMNSSELIELFKQFQQETTIAGMITKLEKSEWFNKDEVPNNDPLDLPVQLDTDNTGRDDSEDNPARGNDPRVSAEPPEAKPATENQPTANAVNIIRINTRKQNPNKEKSFFQKFAKEFYYRAMGKKIKVGPNEWHYSNEGPDFLVTTADKQGKEVSTQMIYTLIRGSDEEVLHFPNVPNTDFGDKVFSKLQAIENRVEPLENGQ